MSARRIETATSRTAEWTCLSRAVSALESDRHYRSDDHLALKLIPAFLKPLLHFNLVRKFFSRVITPQGIYEYTIARTKYIDSVFHDSLASGLPQALIFGAGFDTRALRFQKDAGRATIFELDVPVTQTAKLGQYARRGLCLPPNVVFISIDFDRESLSDKLEQAGFVKGAPSLFVLEGLLMYLQPESVDQTFRVIREFAGPDSVIVFDYVRAPVLRGEGRYYGEESIVRSVTKAGERWNFGLDDGDLEAFLNRFGFELSQRLEARDLERLYFTDDTGRVKGRVNGTHCLVKARKPA